MNDTAQAWGEGFAGAVAAAEASVVRVQGPGRHAGSGTVWSAGGLLWTSARAAGDADEVRVRLPAGEQREAEVVGREPALDLALLRVAGAALQPLEFRPCSELRVGQWTVALGRPGEAIRASARIIGVLGRELRTPLGQKLDAYVETDRGFPPGFSGGPLLDIRGHAFGINSAAILRGADLTVPLATLERLAKQLLAHGRVQRGYLGVAVHPVRLPDALRAQTQRERALLIIEVQPSSPAQSAGLLLGDVLVDIGGEPVSDPRALAALLQDKIDVELTARIVRAGVLQDISLRPGERP